MKRIPQSQLGNHPNHVEANYNLANLLEDRDSLEDAILFYFKSMHEDPEFADAQFNLRRVLERTGEIEEAKKHWQIYLALGPTVSGLNMCELA